MSFKIEINEDELKNFSCNAKIELENNILKFSKELIKETERLEETRRTVSKAEITGTIVNEAANYKKNNFYSKKKSPLKLIIAYVISIISLPCSGFLFDIDKFKTSTTHIIVSFSIFLIAIISTTVQVLWKGEQL